MVGEVSTGILQGYVYWVIGINGTRIVDVCPGECQGSHI